MSCVILHQGSQSAMQSGSPAAVSSGVQYWISGFLPAELFGSKGFCPSVWIVPGFDERFPPHGMVEELEDPDDALDPEVLEPDELEPDVDEPEVVEVVLCAIAPKLMSARLANVATRMYLILLSMRTYAICRFGTIAKSDDHGSPLKQPQFVGSPSPAYSRISASTFS